MIEKWVSGEANKWGTTGKRGRAMEMGNGTEGMGGKGREGKENGGDDNVMLGYFLMLYKLHVNIQRSIKKWLKSEPNIFC
jgi:hypothetical protein